MKGKNSITPSVSPMSEMTWAQLPIMKLIAQTLLRVTR